MDVGYTEVILGPTPRHILRQVLISPLTGMWENGIRRQPWHPKRNPLGRFLISMRSFLRRGKRRASRTNSSTKGHRLITYRQPLSGTGNKNERPPRTRPFCSRGTIAAASPLFRQPRRPHSENPRRGLFRTWQRQVVHPSSYFFEALCRTSESTSASPRNGHRSRSFRRGR
jgi:hypothetical protein